MKRMNGLVVGVMHVLESILCVGVWVFVGIMTVGPLAAIGVGIAYGALSHP